MYKIKVVLDTTTDVNEFVKIANTFDVDVPIYLEDGNGFRANAKSLMGVLYGKFEFKDLYVLSDSETLTSKFLKFMV